MNRTKLLNKIISLLSAESRANAESSAESRIKTNALFASLSKYILVGGSAAGVNWAVFYVLSVWLGAHYALGGLVSFILATLWNFILARKFIFQSSKHSLLRESALIYAVSFGGLLIDMGVLVLCVEMLGFNAMLSKILATGAAFGFNFSMRYFVVYK